MYSLISQTQAFSPGFLFFVFYFGLSPSLLFCSPHLTLLICFVFLPLVIIVFLFLFLFSSSVFCLLHSICFFLFFFFFFLMPFFSSYSSSGRSASTYRGENRKIPWGETKRVSSYVHTVRAVWWHFTTEILIKTLWIWAGNFRIIKKKSKTTTNLTFQHFPARRTFWVWEKFLSS